MYPVLIILHVIVSALLILIILIQSGRSGGFSGLMGGGGGDALFSTSSQQSGMRKATFVIAFLFMCTSFGLTILTSRHSVQSVFQKNFPNLPPLPSAQNQPAAGPGIPSNSAPADQKSNIASPAQSAGSEAPQTTNK